ncbi:MAG TPA: hypothetical protein VFG00_08875 [Acidothermaceae bacterium]|nr:hypothetical protein [Acidothermaceae bacterium]
MAHIIGHAKGEIVTPGLQVARFNAPSPRRKFYDASIAEIAAVAEELQAMMTLTYLSATSANAMLGNITTTGLYMGINSASPGTTGANELVGGTAYTGTRPAVTWAAASSGVVVSSDTQTFAMLVTESGGIPYFSLWTAATAGTYLTGGATSGLSGSIPSGANVTFTSAITLTVAG